MPITRDFLKGLFPEITKEQLDAIMDENGKDIAKHNEQIASLTTERDGLKTQLSQRDTDIADMKKKATDGDTLKAQLEELQAKYKTDTEKLTEDLARQQTDFAVDKLFSGIKFTSELAKKAAIAEFKAKGFKMKDGAFEGGDAFIAEMKKNDATAFVVENPDEGKKAEEGGNPPPIFAAGTKSGGKANDNPFDFGFTSIRTEKK